jgi:predicted NUDIX family NTP pyrophosphohydrolase
MSKIPKQSAGLLMYRIHLGNNEVFLVHPGGPYFSQKNEGSWTIPKGRCETAEQPLAAAIREFQEETGFKVSAPFFELGSIRQKSGKLVFAWAFEGDCDPTELISNTCEIEWPPRSGKRIDIPEVDRGDWFSFDRAREFLRAEQLPLLEALKSLLA